MKARCVHTHIHTYIHTYIDESTARTKLVRKQGIRTYIHTYIHTHSEEKKDDGKDKIHIYTCIHYTYMYINT